MLNSCKYSHYLQYLAKLSFWVYPVVAHVGILMGQITVPVYYLVAIAYINSLKQILQFRAKATLFIILAFTLFILALLYLIFSFRLQPSMIYLPPVLIPGWLAYTFLSSLGSEKALISRIAERMEGAALDARHLLYTRRLTALWGIAFLLMICEAVVLAKWAKFETWSWWVHVGNYFIVGTFFIIEMRVRHHFTGKRAQVVKMLGTMLTRNWHGR